MRRLLIFVLLSTLAGLGCRTPKNALDSEVNETVSPGAKGKVWQQAIRQAQEEQRALQTVTLTDDKEIAKMLGLTVGKHDPKSSTFALGMRKQNYLLVFGKDKNITEDNKKSQKAEWQNTKFIADDDTPLYDKPVQYTFNANPVMNCGQLIAGGNFGKAISKDVFKRVPESDQKSQLCAYVKFSPVGSRPANRAIGELAEANIYLSSDYRPYGLDVAVFKTKRDSERVLVQTDPDYGVSSSLDSIPYDLPNLHSLSRLADQRSSLVSVDEIPTVTLPADPYVQRQLSKAGMGSDPCQGRKALRIVYRDRMGLGKQVVSWCKGDAWPTMIENQKSLSVLVPKQIR